MRKTLCGNDLSLRFLGCPSRGGLGHWLDCPILRGAVVCPVTLDPSGRELDPDGRPLPPFALQLKGSPENLSSLPHHGQPEMAFGRTGLRVEPGTIVPDGEFSALVVGLKRYPHVVRAR